MPESKQGRSKPTWVNQLWHARQLPSSELRRHARVSLSNRHECHKCFCCAAVTVMRERQEIPDNRVKAVRIIDAMEGN